MHGQDAGDLFEVVLDVVVIDAPGCALEEDESRVLDCFWCQLSALQGAREVCPWGGRTKWDGGEEDHDGNAHAHGWIGVESTTVVGEPDHCRGNDDTEVIRAVADDVEEHAHHGEVSVRLVRGVLLIDMVFVVDVLVMLVFGMTDG